MEDDIANLKHNVVRVGVVFFCAFLTGLLVPFVPDVNALGYCVHVAEIGAAIALGLLCFLLMACPPKSGSHYVVPTSRSNSVGDSSRVALITISALGFGALTSTETPLTDIEPSFAAGSFLLSAIVVLVSWHIQKVKSLSRQKVLVEEQGDFESEIASVWYLRNETYDLISGALVTFGLTYIFAASLT